MQYSEKSIIRELKTPSKTHLITCRISRNEYDLLLRLKKIMKLNSSQLIRYALSGLKKKI